MTTTLPIHLRHPGADESAAAGAAAAPAAPISRTMTIIANGDVTVHALEGTYRRPAGATDWSFASADGRHAVDAVTAHTTLAWLNAEAELRRPPLLAQRHLRLLVAS